MLKTIENKYSGIVVVTDSLPPAKEDFEKEMCHLIAQQKDKKLLWVNLPIEKSDYIPILTNMGFEYHHCDERNLMLIKKLDDAAIIPTTKNFIVGVGAIVFNDTQILVIKDKFIPGYKLPGGHVDKKETIIGALKREVYEETGIEIQFESIMNIGHFRTGQFGESNIYFVCTAKPLTLNITINDDSEIAEAKWMNIDDFINSNDVNEYNKCVVKAAITNNELKLTEQHIDLRVYGGEVFF